MSLNLDKSTWKRVALGDVIRRSRKQVDPLSGGVERYVAGGHVDSEGITVNRWGHVDDGQMGSTFRYAFDPGHVLFVSARPYLRKVGIPNFSGVVADKTYVLEALPENGLLHEFLPFVLSSEKFIDYATAEATGSMNPRLLWGQMQQYTFDLPTLNEQKRLAELLWAAEQHQQALSRKKEQVASATEIQFYYLLKDNNWPLIAVPRLITAGPTNGKSAPANDEAKGIPTLSISAVRGGRIVGGSSIKYIDIPSESARKFVIDDNDFLIIRGNGNKQLTGKGGIACGGLPKGCIYPDLLIRLKFDAAKILPKFAAVQWNADFRHGVLLKKAKSTNGIWKINGKDIKSHALVAPPLDIQRKILDNVQTFQAASIAIEREAFRISNIRSLMCRSIFG